MLEHLAPLAQLSRAEGPSTIEAPGLRVVAVDNRGFVLLQGDPEDPLLHRAMREQIGVELPGPQVASVGGDCALLWMAPRQWLLDLPVARAPTVQAALVTRLGPAAAAVTDISDALACFDVSGDSAADALMTGCTLDLHSHAFAAGRVARTGFAGVPLIICRPDNPNQFRCLVDRSFAAHVWSWFAQVPSGFVR
jgi:heterotetrameric sarcosine oxidase gamma subunit